MKNTLSLAWRYIKNQKKHSFFIIICVMLSVALTAFTLIAFSSINENIRRYHISVNGTAQAVITGLTREQAELLAHNAAFSDSEIFCCTDFSTRYNYNAEENVYTEFLANGNEMPWTYFLAGAECRLVKDVLLSGRMPQNDSEIVLDRNCGYETGDAVVITMKTISSLWADGKRTDTVLGEASKTYTVCGISGAGSDMFSYSSSYVHESDSFIFGSGTNAVCSLAVRFADHDANLTATVTEICEEAQIPLTGFEDSVILFPYGLCKCGFNTDLLMAEAVGSEARSDIVVGLAWTYIVVLLILASGRMIIDCEFELTCAKKHKHMGLLMAIGADDKQLVAITTVEGIILGVTAVPLGLLLGWGLAELAAAVIEADGSINYILSDGAGVSVIVNPLYMLLAAVTGIGWVFFSAYGTAVRIKKVNPVEAVRGMKKSGKFPYPKRKKGGKLTQRIFLRNISVSTFRTERKRFFSTSIAVIISMVMFTGVTYSVRMAEDMVETFAEGARSGYYSTDFYAGGYMTRGEYHALADKLNDSGYFTVKDYSVIKGDHINARFLISEEDGSFFYTDNIVPVDREQFDALFGYSGITYDEAAENGYILQRVLDRTEITKQKGVADFISVNDSASIVANDSTGVPSLDAVIVLMPKLLADGEMPVSDGCAYMTRDFMDSYIDKVYKAVPELDETRINYSISLMLKDTEEYDEAVRWLDESKIYYEDWFIPYLRMQAVIRIISVIGYAATVVSVLIAVSNIINITVSGITENKQGFALLRAAGMTDRQLEKTAAVQALIPIGDAAFISFFLSVLIAIGIWFLIRATLAMDYYMFADYGFTGYDIVYGLRQYIIAAVSAAVISLLACVMPIGEIEREAISEAVKTE